MAQVTVSNKVKEPAHPSSGACGLSLADMQREMELLGYVTSHNLQSPLRAILSCCEEIARQPGVRTKNVSIENMDLLASESLRLKEMMRLMVEYIQLETHRVSFADVNLSEVIDTVRTMLAAEIDQSGARIECDELPTVYGHHGRITRLFAYIIENAIKFHGSMPCIIRVSAKNQEDVCEISITDNGIGIAKDNQDIIFKLFKRLHTAEEYPGYGAGLSLAQKIVRSHGGMIGVESTEGHGSRFYFTLPKTNI